MSFESYSSRSKVFIMFYYIFVHFVALINDVFPYFMFPNCVSRSHTKNPFYNLYLQLNIYVAISYVLHFTFRIFIINYCYFICNNYDVSYFNEYFCAYFTFFLYQGYISLGTFSPFVNVCSNLWINLINSARLILKSIILL